MKREIVSAALGLWLCAAPGAYAQEAARPVVVELYTSQGCSSCPPADALLRELAREPGVIPLALHVDYWDYIGWEDKFAHPSFTKRQKAYAGAVGDHMVYTPQMVIAGGERVVGNEPGTVRRAIAKAAAKKSPVHLTAERVGGKIVIRAEARSPLSGPVMVQLVSYRDGATVDIKRGENAGRSVVYSNIVTSWKRLDDWSGKAPLELRTDAGTGGPVVVIVQEQGPAEVLAAVRVE